MFGRHRKEMKQEGGRESSNLQAGRDVIVVQGFSPAEVRDIVRDAIAANVMEMRALAAEVAQDRIDRFSDMLIDRLAQEDGQLVAAISDPDVQYAVVQAGVGYARTGDEDMAGVLVDLLADRARVETRSLLAVVIDDAVTVAPRLTDGEIAALTVYWRLAHTVNNAVTSLDALESWIRTELSPLVPYLPMGQASYLHLQALGCAVVQITEVDFRIPWVNTYGGLFTDGFAAEELPEAVQEAARHPEAVQLLIPALRDKNRWQINAMNSAAIEKLHGDKLGPDLVPEVKALLESRLMDEERIAKVLETIDPAMGRLREIWKSTPLKSLRLSAVGMAVAHANWRYLTGATAPLSIWINELADS